LVARPDKKRLKRGDTWGVLLSGVEKREESLKPIRKELAIFSTELNPRTTSGC
jgi:hypothetical protein